MPDQKRMKGWHKILIERSRRSLYWKLLSHFLFVSSCILLLLAFFFFLTFYPGTFLFTSCPDKHKCQSCSMHPCMYSVCQKLRKTRKFNDANVKCYKVGCVVLIFCPFSFVVSGCMSEADCTWQWWSGSIVMLSNRRRVRYTMCLLLQWRIWTKRSQVYWMSKWHFMEWDRSIVLCERSVFKKSCWKSFTPQPNHLFNISYLSRVLVLLHRKSSNRVKVIEDVFLYYIPCIIRYYMWWGYMLKKVCFIDTPFSIICELIMIIYLYLNRLSCSINIRARARRRSVHNVYAK